MKKLILLIAIFYCSSNAFAQQSPTWQWAFSAGEINHDYMNDIACNDSENVIYAVGRFDSTITFGADTLVDSLGKGNSYLSSFSENGILNWVIQISGTSVNINRIIYKDGFIYLLGYDHGIVEIDNVLYDSLGTVQGTFVAKLSNIGSLIWYKHLLSSNTYSKGSIDVDDNQNVYFSTSYYDTLIVDQDTLIGWSYPHSNTCIISLNDSGQVRWTKKLDCFFADDLTISDNGELYSTSYFWDTLTLDTFHIYPKTNTEILLTKMDLSGNITWVSHSSGRVPGNELKGAPIKTTKQGLIYESLVIEDTVYLSTTVGDSLLIIPNSRHLIVCYRPDGSLLWTLPLICNDSLAGGIFIHDISCDSLGNAYILGYARDSMYVSSFRIPDFSVFIFKSDSLGNIKWLKQNPNSGSMQFPITIDVNLKGEIYCGGTFFSNANLDSINFSSQGFSDLWLAKLGDSTNLFIQVPTIQTNNWKVYPNPSNGSFTISTNEISDEMIFSVYNILGGLVNSIVTDVNRNSKQVTINAAPGIYFLNVSNEKENLTFKLIKE